jgi:hypothetical protein
MLTLEDELRWESEVLERQLRIAASMDAYCAAHPDETSVRIPRAAR